MDSLTRVLYWLLEGTRGGPTRLRIVSSLHKKPRNMRQLALSLSLDYKTVEEHVGLLSKNGVLDVQGGGYGKLYFISPQFEGNEYFRKSIGGSKHGKKTSA